MVPQPGFKQARQVSKDETLHLNNSEMAPRLEQHAEHGKGETGFSGIKTRKKNLEIPHSLYYHCEKQKETTSK